MLIWQAMHKVAEKVDASALSASWYAMACSTTSRGTEVLSPAQSRNVDRKPCTVIVLRPMRRSSMDIAMTDSLPTEGVGMVLLLLPEAARHIGTAGTTSLMPM